MRAIELNDFVLFLGTARVKECELTFLSSSCAWSTGLTLDSTVIRSANEKGIKLDAQTALDYVLSHEKLEKTKLYLYGQSIGGAVSIFVASQNAQRVHGLIIENTFLSLVRLFGSFLTKQQFRTDVSSDSQPKLVPHVLPFLSPFVPFLLHQIWPSERYISTLPKDFPVLFLAGSRDELVEPGQMKGLWKVCGSDNKEWKEFENGTHSKSLSLFYI